MEKSLKLDQLKSFALVLQCGSFSAAADRLGLTQPAVSLQIKQLERSLSVRLIERVGKRATATTAGTELLRHVHHIEAAVDNAIEALADHATGVAGRVRLGSGATVCLYFLPAVLRALRDQYPGLHIMVGTGNSDDYARKVEDNSIDLALATLPLTGRSLVSTPVLRDEFVAIARPGSTDLKAQVSPAGLAGLPLVLFEPAAHTRRLVDRWFAAAGLAPQPVMELGSVEAIKEMVSAGLGVGIVPRMAVDSPKSRAGLDVHGLRPRLYRTLALVTRRDKPMNKGMKLLFDAIVLAGKKRPSD